MSGAVDSVKKILPAAAAIAATYFMPAGAPLWATMAAAVTASYATARIVGTNDFNEEAFPGMSADAEQGILVNKAGNNEPILPIYGSRRVATTRVFLEVTGESNEYLHYVGVIGEGPISAINTVYFNDVPSTDDRFKDLATAAVSGDPDTSLTEEMASGDPGTMVMVKELAASTSGMIRTSFRLYADNADETLILPTVYAQVYKNGEPLGERQAAGIAGGVFEETFSGIEAGDNIQIYGNVSARVETWIADFYLWEVTPAYYGEVHKHLGEDDQEADADLVAAVPGWTADHRGRGVAYLYIKFKYNRDVFPTGLPRITADVDGLTVLDPRDDAIKFAHNPALYIRDYLLNSRYGRGVAESLVPDEYIEAAANYCEEQVTVGGVTQDRYTCDGVIDVNDTALSNMTKLLSSCRGNLVFTGGEYRLIIDKPETSTFDFNEDNITGSWKISLGSKRTMFNRIRANFFNPDRDWQPDIAPVDSSALRALDNGLMLDGQIDLPFTANINTAKQIGTIEMNGSREPIVAEFTAFSEGLRCEVCDVGTITHSTPGWSGKKFRIKKMELKNDDEVIVTVQKYNDAVYDFGTILAASPTPNTNLPNLLTAGSPQSLDVQEEIYETVSGKGVQTRADVSWEPPADAFVSSYEVEYRPAATNIWTFATVTRGTSVFVLDMAPGTYDFRVRSRNTLDIPSGWTYLYGKELIGLTAPPADIENFILRALGGQAHLQWQRATELDVIHGGYIRIRYTPLLSGAAWENGTDIGPALSGAATNAVLPLLPGTYMARAVDSSGNYSVNAAAAVTTMSDILAMNVVETQTEDPGFSGTKTNMVVDDSGVLMIAGMPGKLLTEDGDFLTTEDGDYLITENQAGTESPIFSAGTYLFSEALDLGGVYKSRVTCNFEYAGTQLDDLFDSRTGLIDSWGLFDGEPSDGTVAKLYVRTTEDDPAGSPVWSDWAEFVIGDYLARAFEFKVEATTDNQNFNVLISSLSVTVDMPDRTERGIAVSVPDTGLDVTFAQPFKATPALGITMNNMATGDYFTPSSKTRTGFHIDTKNSGGAGVARSIDWTAVGYGGEIL